MARNERRSNTRVAFQTTMDVAFTGGRKYPGCAIQDLSVKGVFLVGVRQQAVGDRCDLTLCLSGTSSELCLRMQGEVMRVEDGGVGVHFIEMDIDSFYHLKNIVYFNAAEPDHIQEQLVE